MIQIIDHVEVRKRIRQKQAIEVNLTHEIYDTFNQLPWLGEIRMTVKAGLRAMLNDDEHYLTEACEEEKNLYVWKRHNVPASRYGVATLYKLCGSLHPDRPYLDSIGSLSAVDCGDLMRLIGAWIEVKPDADAARNWTLLRHHIRRKIAADKSEERVGKGDAGGPWDQIVQGTRMREWIADFKKQYHFRRRDVVTDAQGGRTVTYGTAFENVMINKAPIDFRKAMLAFGQDKHADQGKGESGRQLKRIPKYSNDSVLKIDRLFGLRDICSISGTTADVMYILDKFGARAANGFRDLGHIYRVLPFGTIAGFHHHSVLEVALPQSLKEYIDYRVGQYTTLVPEESNFSSPLTRSLWNTAWKYEKEVYDKGLHMICFYDEGFPEGAIVFEGKDEWERFFNSGLSSARRLSEVAPIIPAGYLTLERALSAIRTIDHAFWYWLTMKLRTECQVELAEAWRPPSERRRERLAGLRAA